MIGELHSGTRRRCGMMDIVSYVQGLARPLVIIHYLYVSTASFERDS